MSGAAFHRGAVYKAQSSQNPLLRHASHFNALLSITIVAKSIMSSTMTAVPVSYSSNSTSKPSSGSSSSQTAIRTGAATNGPVFFP